MKIVVASLVAMLSMAVLLGVNQVGEKAKYKSSEVMQKAMKGGLCGKVAGGKASDEEKKQLVELFTALSQNTPPKGEAASWKEKTGALVAAAKAAAAGDAKAGAALKSAANCAACHKAHKG